MTHAITDPSGYEPRYSRLALVLAGVAAAQLFAMWLLCTHQVRVAEARQTEVSMAAAAMADCLQYIPGATIASCNARIAARATAPADASPAMAVSYTYR
jgi:hypothetical protein